LDKAKPFVRMGRKVTGLQDKTAGLPIDKVVRPFFCNDNPN